MPSNLEIKARTEDFQVAKNLASKISDDPKPRVLEQRDTFFLVPNGRLKLREQRDSLNPEGDSELTFAELIAYDRADSDGPKQSKFSKSKIADPESLRTVLATSLGVKGEVKKVRHLFMVGQTRVHLDRVEGLDGAFLELEVMMMEDQSTEDGEKIVDDLMGKLNVVESDLISGAYMDLLLKKD